MGVAYHQGNTKKHTRITEEDLRDIEPILIAARNAVLRSDWRIGDPIEKLSGFIALVVIARVSLMLKDIGIITDEPKDGPDDCGFYA